MKLECVRSCATCGLAKPETEFRLRKSHATGLHYRGKVCRACHQKKSLAWRKANPGRVQKYNAKAREKDPDRNRKLALESHFRRKFGITMQQRDEMLESQGGRCMICDTDTPRGKGWCVDHHHDNGRIRGILCAPCNSFIGLAKESVVILQRAIKYLGDNQ